MLPPPHQCRCPPSPPSRLMAAQCAPTLTGAGTTHSHNHHHREFANTLGGGKPWWYSTSKHHQLEWNLSNLHCSSERRVIFAIEIAHISGTHGEDSLLLVASSQPMHSVQIILRCSSGWICRYLAPAVDIWRPVVDISTHRE